MFRKLLIFLFILLLSSCGKEINNQSLNKELVPNNNKLVGFVATWSSSSKDFVKKIESLSGINTEINVINYKPFNTNIKQNYQNPKYYSDYVGKDCIYVPSYVILNKSGVVIDKGCGNFDINNIKPKLFFKKEEIVKSKIKTGYNLSTGGNLRRNYRKSFDIGNYSCGFISSAQTDFYDNPKGGIVKYIGHSGNFTYSNLYKGKPSFKRVILEKGNFFSDGFSSKYSHNYIYTNSGNKFAYRGDKEIIIRITNNWDNGNFRKIKRFKIDTSNMGIVFLQGFYKDGFLFTIRNKARSFKEQKEKLIYVDLSGDKPKLQTIFDYKYKYIWQLVVSKDKQHYAFGGDGDLIFDGKKIKTIFGKIDRIKFYGRSNKIAFIYKKGREIGVYVDLKKYLSYKDNIYYSTIYSLTYIDFLDKFAFVINGDKLIIGKKEHVYKLNTNNIGTIFVDSKNKKLYHYYGIKTEDPRKNGYKYGYLVINLEKFERKDSKIFDGMKYVDLSDNGDFGFLEKEGIYINGKLIVSNTGSVIRGFSFGSGSYFYFAKYVEKEENKQTLSFINNYRCSLDR